MKRLSFLLLTIIFLIFQSCSKHDPIPDYASKLEGEFDIGYLIIDTETKEIDSSKLGVSRHAKINLKRKSNQYLTATVTIDDENIKFSDSFEVAVSISKDQTDSLGKPGFVSKYTATVISTVGANMTTDWSLYEDGSIIGFIQYSDESKIKRISIGSNF